MPQERKREKNNYPSHVILLVLKVRSPNYSYLYSVVLSGNKKVKKTKRCKEKEEKATPKKEIEIEVKEKTSLRSALILRVCCTKLYCSPIDA